VSAGFDCNPRYQGYPDRLHGGIIATLLDAAMTHCLFARQVRGVTAKLNIRYHLPALIEQPAQVRAWVVGEKAPLYVLRGELHQAGKLRVTAEGTFLGE
jgi:acyl-coenzyme A thioesterase PaaI-like protein